ncbi:hypothetical protein Mgra_00003966, partial [Meloidogyne graminicola]
MCANYFPKKIKFLKKKSVVRIPTFLCLFERGNSAESFKPKKSIDCGHFEKVGAGQRMCANYFPKIIKFLKKKSVVRISTFLCLFERGNSAESFKP